MIGWLYGTDFGDALCKTVNCGYDTDSSGGSIGSWLGIRAGLSQLPAKWVEPFGLGLSTNESWGGVRHLSDGSRPIPTDVVELTAQVMEVAPDILRHHGVALDGSVLTVEEADLFADDAVRALWERSPWQVTQRNRGLEITVDYRGRVAARPGENQRLGLRLRNPHPDAVEVDLQVAVPDGWPAVADQWVSVAADGATELDLAISVPDRSAVQQRNIVRISADVVGRPADPSVPVALPGAQAWRVRDARASDGEESWREISVDGNELPLAELLAETDTVVLQHFLEVPEAREVRLGIDCTTSTRARLNGTMIIDVEGPRLIRPSYGVGEQMNPIVTLEAGFNELLVEVRRAGSAIQEGHTFLSTPDRLRHGIVDVGRTRFPWE